MEARDYLIVIREQGKLTQAQIAERTGIPQPTISKIERGDVADVMSRNYRALQALHDEVVAGGHVTESPAPAQVRTVSLVPAGIKPGLPPSPQGKSTPEVEESMAISAKSGLIERRNRPRDVAPAHPTAKEQGMHHVTALDQVGRQTVGDLPKPT